MSSTTTTLSVLADYELHHSGNEEEEDNQTARRTSSSASTSPSPAAQQPSNWPTTGHRRIPLYRAANREQDLTQRTAGSNAAEYVFIQVMLHGVWLNASVSRLWRKTGGMINDGIFRYDVGGEW